MTLPEGVRSCPGYQNNSTAKHIGVTYAIIKVLLLSSNCCGEFVLYGWYFIRFYFVYEVQVFLARAFSVGSG